MEFGGSEADIDYTLSYTSTRYMAAQWKMEGRTGRGGRPFVCSFDWDMANYLCIWYTMRVLLGEGKHIVVEYYGDRR